MDRALVDSSVILDLVTNDKHWAQWSEDTLSRLRSSAQLCINSIIYSEISIGYNKIEEVEYLVSELGLKVLPIPKESLFLAGKAFLNYKKRHGIKNTVLPDFFIGAHAAVENLVIATRDIKRIKTNYPTVKLISP